MVVVGLLVVSFVGLLISGLLISSNPDLETKLDRINAEADEKLRGER